MKTNPDGRKTLAKLTKHFDPLPQTPRVLSGSDHSYHVHFDHPENIVIARNIGGIGNGLDIIAERSLIVLPGSRHQNGKLYTFALGLDPITVPRAQMPQWLVDLATSKSGQRHTHGKKRCGGCGEHSTGKRFDMALIKTGVPGGQRDDLLFRFASKLRGQNCPREEAERKVLAAAHRCKPPFPDNEALAKVESAYTRFAPGNAVAEILTPEGEHWGWRTGNGQYQQD